MAAPLKKEKTDYHEYIFFVEFSLSGDYNSVWFFEKECSRMQDLTPVYEGTIIEYQHTVKVSIIYFKKRCILLGTLRYIVSSYGYR